MCNGYIENDKPVQTMVITAVLEFGFTVIHFICRTNSFPSVDEKKVTVEQNPDVNVWLLFSGWILAKSFVIADRNYRIYAIGELRGFNIEIF